MQIKSNILNFIEMCTRNMDLKLSNPVEDAHALIFDLDDCLYQSKEFLDDYFSKARALYTKLSGSDSEEDWKSFKEVPITFKQQFHERFKLSLSEIEEAVEFPEIHKFVQPDPELIKILEDIKYRKFVLTNGSAKRAEVILKYLKLNHLFEAVICADVVETEFILKPDVRAFQFVQTFLGVNDPANLHFFDDSSKNIQGALLCGWNAVHVTSDIKEFIITVVDRLQEEELEVKTDKEIINVS